MPVFTSRFSSELKLSLLIILKLLSSSLDHTSQPQDLQICNTNDDVGTTLTTELDTLPVKLDMLKKNSRSPQTQKCDLQEINEDNLQTHKIYHFQNCGTVNLNMDSFNTRTITMENCGNKIPQVTIYHRDSDNEKSDKNLYFKPHGVSSDDQPPQNGLDYIMLFSTSLLVVSCLMVFIMDLPHPCDVRGMNVGGLL